MIRVLIVDTDATRSTTLTRTLDGTAGVEVLATVEDGRMACDAVMALNPDVVVMAGTLPLLSGEDATAWVSTECPSVRVLRHTRRRLLTSPRLLRRCGRSPASTRRERLCKPSCPTASKLTTTAAQ